MNNDLSRQVASNVSRRGFLKTGSVLAAGVYLGTSVEARADAPSEKLNLACIGVGGRGSANVGGVGGENLVAFADVDDNRAAGSYKKHPKAEQFRDYRKLLDKHGSKLDGIVISTPDHMHFHPGYAAMELGLHVYLEKPLAHNVWETRTLTDMARKKKLATQLGAQRHAMPNMHRVVEIVKSGAIGNVKEVYCWVGGSRGMPKLPEDTPAVPANLDYELWLGPAPERPYHPSFCPYGWRFWWDYGTGETGNWGCHILDIPFWALDLKYPTRVDASGPEVDEERTPNAMQTTFDFPARGKLSAVKLHWHHGTPPALKEMGMNLKGANTVFIGDKATLICGFGSYHFHSDEFAAEFKPPAKSIEDSPGFHREWLNACRGGAAATCDFDYSGPLAETVLLGNVAYRTGGFDWDAKNLKTVGNEAAQKLIQESYRPGWEIAAS